MTNTTKIRYIKSPKPAGSVKLRAGESITITGPDAGRVTSAPTISYRKAR